MEVTIKSGIAIEEPIDVLVIPVIKNEPVPISVPGPDPDVFTATRGETLWSYHPEYKRLVHIGLGESKDLETDVVRKTIGGIARTIREKKLSRIAITCPVALPVSIPQATFIEVAVEAVILGSYRFEKLISDEKRKKPPVEKLVLYTIEKNGGDFQLAAEYGKTIAEAVNFARDLANHPHNHMDAVELATRAEKMAKASSLEVSVLKKEDIEKENMNLLLSVNQGSEIPPRLVVLDYCPADHGKTLVLVGKGITFDSGGLSLKPVAGMGNMIYDMCGAAAVIGAMAAVARLKPPGIRVVGLTPLTDNCPSGSAYKPGDILTSKSGKTVEIISTDAEGRLILADTLTYAERYDPDYVIDFATLTGACKIALGSIQAGVFFNSRVKEAIKEKLFKSASYTGDFIWEMPLNKEYLDVIKSKHGDLKNSGGRFGGVSTSAIFLAQFAGKYPWTHIDIAGVAHRGLPDSGKASGYNPHGATGFGVRLVADFIRRWMGE